MGVAPTVETASVSLFVHEKLNPKPQAAVNSQILAFPALFDAMPHPKPIKPKA